MKSLVRMQKRRKGRSSRLCTCTSPPAQPASSSLLSWCITSHSFGCPLYVSEQRVIHLGTRYVICNRLLRFSVNASLNIAYGAGGLSINPQLNFRAVVPDDAPVFKALSDAVKKMHKSPDTAIIDDTTKVILQLFRAGKASPTDSLSDGQTILHVLLRWIHPENPQWDVSLWQRYREMLITLIEAGVSLGSLNDRSESPLDVVLSSICFFGRLEPTNVMSICLCLLQKGALVTPAWAGGIDNQVMKSNWLITILATHCGIEYLDFPEKYLLHVTRSKQDLYAAMAQEKSPELLFRCLEWPMGLYTLIREGYKPSRRVLQTACEYDCEGAVNVLLGERRFNIGRSELTSPKAARQQTTKLIVAALANKRRRLQALAETHLPSETLSQLGIRSDCLMGFNAAAVCARLRANSVSIRRDLMEGKGWLIYNGGWWGCKSADLLWDAGFRNIDETDEQGFTALMHTPQYPESVHQFLPLLIYAQWLVSHGANIYHPRQEAPALHYLAENVGLSLDNDWIFGLCQESYYRESLNHMPAGCVEVVRKILLDEGTDKCCCPCSFNGCSALTRLLAGLYREHKLWNKLELLLWAWETLVRYAFPECERLWHTQSSRVLRYCTFEKMDLTHTCRNHRYRESKDQDDIIDILEAQKESTDLFEALVAEFEAEYNQMGVPLPEFLRSHWLQRMKMVLERQSVPNQEYMDRVREIGVVLEDCQNVE
ncbi:hypothetical protein BO78DRAFT_401250 [Aspergillus sclerotiicarbonarius CBS 121057]|uniref:Ankyrin n=1 Tax=Aspergillus sclerotiicarbonarius (strain CBS 121057 / IBT 28362) TaxID=1448318 RepID=A0A319DUU0_ASPSB|nr:hypothetical protein BO78DRAFT_401250 [Aspergillus sclerotiicarbonarius CBS 121057]